MVIRLAPGRTYWPGRTARAPTTPATGARISVRVRLILAWSTAAAAAAASATVWARAEPRDWAVRRSASRVASAWERAASACRAPALTVCTRWAETHPCSDRRS